MTYDVSLTWFDERLLDCLEGKILARLGFSFTTMHLRRITFTKQLSDWEFFFQIEQDYKAFHCLYPRGRIVFANWVELVRITFGHQDEAVHSVVLDIFELHSFQSTVFYFEYTSLLIIVRVLIESQ